MYGGLPPDTKKGPSTALPLLGERGTGHDVRVSGGDWVTLEAHPSIVGN